MDARIRPFLKPGELVVARRVREMTGITQKELNYLRITKAITIAGKNSNNWALYDDETIAEIFRRKQRFSSDFMNPELPPPDINYTKEEALLVFRLLQEGRMTHQQIILEAQVDPRIFRAIRREYELTFECVFVDKETLQKMNELPLDGSFPLKNASMILEVMEQAAQETRTKCKTCKRRPKSERCPGCERQRVLRSLAEKTSTRKTKRSKKSIEEAA